MKEKIQQLWNESEMNLVDLRKGGSQGTRILWVRRMMTGDSVKGRQSSDHLRGM